LLAALIGTVAAFQAPATMQQVSRASVTSSADVTMFFGGGGASPKKSEPASAPKKSVFGGSRGKASPTRPVVSNKAKPLSPGSNYPTTRNIQVQQSGFGSFLQKFQTAKGKSKYGVPIFLPNGNVNPAYLAAERAEMAAQKKRNITEAEKKRKGLIAGKSFELADYVRKKIGNVGSGEDYYKSGR